MRHGEIGAISLPIEFIIFGMRGVLWELKIERCRCQLYTRAHGAPVLFDYAHNLEGRPVWSYGASLPRKRQNAIQNVGDASLSRG